MSVYDKLQSLGIQLPEALVPAASYAPFVRKGNLIFLSGHLARRAGQVWVGRLGATMSTQQGSDAAREVAIDLIGTLQ